MAIVIKGSMNRVEEKPQPQTAPRPKPESFESLRNAASITPAAPVESKPTRVRNIEPPVAEAKPEVNMKFARAQPRQYRNPNENLLIVDGKEKKIGRQSKYLVDMLTIEE